MFIAYSPNPNLGPAFEKAGIKTKIILIVVNDTWSTGSFGIQYNGKFANIRLKPGAVGTYVW